MERQRARLDVLRDQCAKATTKRDDAISALIRSEARLNKLRKQVARADKALRAARKKPPVPKIEPPAVPADEAAARKVARGASKLMGEFLRG